MTELTPEPWVKMVNDHVLTPYVKPEQVVFDEQTKELFDSFDGRARAHALARSEHTAMVYLHVYAVWNESLWRVAYDSWEDYCDEWDKAPYGISKSSIKHKMADIKKALSAGVTPATIVKALGNIPMATRNLLEDMVGEDKGEMYVNRAFMERMPEGMTPDQYLNELAELGPIQANLAIDELRDRLVMFVPEAEYDERTGRLLFRLVSRSPKGDLETDLFIPAVPDWAAKFLIKRLRSR